MNTERDSKNFENDPIPRINRLVTYCIILSLMVLMLCGGIYWTYNHQRQIPNAEIKSADAAHVQNHLSDNSPEGELAAYGEQLITSTAALLGPDTKMKITGNKLACTNCHLQAGTKPFAAPYIGLTDKFPTYIGREDKIETLEERINGCFERSMNGSSISVESREMRAIVTYIKHISKGTILGDTLRGRGFTRIAHLPRAASPQQGQTVYIAKCASCHGKEGQGQPGDNPNGYTYPPLWGPHSYNDGAGMARLLTAAAFIKGNMPFGATAENPLLTDEEALDVAAYINSQPRPVKSNKEKDYPDLTKKPKDSPYPPYADQISQHQHQYGPYNFSAK
ncbi:thiosulfate dehydrogenase [Chitinophaga dinghuensis]|uniref:Thiosulfate dehydrogenase n=1 Tax=Chitinophaga dinghuensis TaxID=1539050 RepID=A0A327VPE1_9BACT|nr:c-type cytochrome [Chitinophaga dinghuensis]RAJ75636.1 thiosulfate dehydrogenase [Chitinophaga dinghuensis]